MNTLSLLTVLFAACLCLFSAPVYCEEIDCTSLLQTACEEASKCKWDEGNASCTAKQCSDFSKNMKACTNNCEGQCKSLGGCKWKKGRKKCKPEPKPCNEVDEAKTCKRRPKCEWDEGNDGNASCRDKKCSDFSKFSKAGLGDCKRKCKKKCKRFGGCTWKKGRKKCKPKK